MRAAVVPHHQLAVVVTVATLVAFVISHSKFRVRWPHLHADLMQMVEFDKFAIAKLRP